MRSREVGGWGAGGRKQFFLCYSERHCTHPQFNADTIKRKGYLSAHYLSPIKKRKAQRRRRWEKTHTRNLAEPERDEVTPMTSQRKHVFEVDKAWNCKAKGEPALRGGQF